MIQGKKKVELNKEAILNRISEYDIFKMYMPNKWKINDVCLSPFRAEKNPSFMIGNRNGFLSFIDFGATQYKGDCFEFVQMYFNLKNIDEILKKIDTDFKLGISSGTFSTEYKMIVSNYKQPEEIGKRYSLIQVITRPFTLEELAYWNEYHQDISDLRNEKIYSLSKVYLNRKLFSLKNTDLRFGYFYEGQWKVYRPFVSKKIKWVPNNVPITVMDGLKNLVKDKDAFVCGSKKDYMVVKKVYEHSCATQNEGVACFSDKNISFLKDNSKKQIIGYDSDVPGVQNSQQITKMFDFDYCNPPKIYLKKGINDWAGLAKEYGLNKLESYFKSKSII